MESRPAGRIILVRHGETEANRRRHFAESNELPLTETGKRQAHELAERLASEFHPAALFTSSFLRARQTAAIIGAALDLAPKVLPGLHERDFGLLKGQPYERMGELMLADAAYDRAKPWLWVAPEGESLDQVRTRVIPALEQAPEIFTGDTVVVCHGAVIQAVCAHATGEWRESFVPPNCGYAVIGFGPGGWSEPVVSGAWDNLATVAL